MLVQDQSDLPINNPPVAGVEVSSNASRTRVDLSAFNEARLQFMVSTNSSAIACRVEFSTDSGANWTTLIGPLSSGTNGNDLNVSAYSAIPAGARGDVTLRAMIIGTGGNPDPVVRTIRLDVR